MILSLPIIFLGSRSRKGSDPKLFGYYFILKHILWTHPGVASERQFQGEPIIYAKVENQRKNLANHLLLSFL